MTLTTYPATTDPSDLAALNLSRLLTRLEHNLLSPNADLQPLQRSEYQRMRVGANIEYARTHLQALERSLSQVKPVDRRHDLQSSLIRNKQTLKRLQNVLDEIQAEMDARSSARSSEYGEDTDFDDEDDNDTNDEGSIDEEDLLGTPSTTTEEGSREDVTLEDDVTTSGPGPRITATPTATVTTIHKEEMNQQPTTTISSNTSATATPIATLRNRHHTSLAPPPLPPSSTAAATGTSLHPSTTTTSSPDTHPQTKAQETEVALSSDRLEQETLTTSLLSLATQLKTSSQAFHDSLEAEKSVLTRAVDGLDRTTGNMKTAEQRMGMLRRMTEGKGWWGRMMLYAWIFGLWVVAVLIVFVGPKLRF
ncbi:hypothetical protein ARAM_002726 [Aspergillus rambellii]|uniref:Synaptobrevin n=1 Tax=Aspergillus rambellii TaxID=308745 RepID=A0A0F8UML8_9EURO|nr:hypothetical protein ARAM_002726 [Aspergillus rambellii]